ncbi:hypothetical protein [Microlunatus ginsengisoli]|uniref:Uncharacterized protein n=1 Tax=Microlunatus ginsengisoli TaxID=363863 RepID=A0ABP6ZTP7_9ACTN
MSTTGWIVLAVVAVIVIVVGLLIFRRVRYVRGLKQRGWTFDSSPPLEAVLDHHAPPFGIGLSRKPDELVSGSTAEGIPFRVFEYAYTGGGPKFDQRLASLTLPTALPDLFLTAGRPRIGITAPSYDIEAGLTVSADDPTYARAMLDAAVPAIRAFGAERGVDLSIDGNHLVSVGAPKNADELTDYLEALAPVAQAIARGGGTYAVPTPAPGFGFYRRDWFYVGRDDALISRYGLTTVGHGHRTEDVIRGDNDGLPLEAFVHRWETTRTETSTDSEGRTTTRTVTDHHDETVLAMVMPFSLPMLSVGVGGWGGEKVRFESEEFNDAFKVRTSSPKFASDVIHPRQMEYLMSMRPPAFSIDGQLIRFFPSQHDTLLIGLCADVAHGLLARVPPFVWKDLQVAPPTFRA